MSKQTAAHAATDPRVLSPKVKAQGLAGVVIVAALVVVGAFLTSIPREALADLGPWAGPVGAAIAALAGVLAGYAKHDPARDPSLLLTTEGGVYTSQADVEAERFIRGEYASNAVGPTVAHERPEPEADEVQAARVIAVDKFLTPGEDDAGVAVDPELSRSTEVATEVLHRQLLDQYDPARDA